MNELPSIADIVPLITPEIKQSASDFASLTADPTVTIKIRIDDTAFKKLKGIARALRLHENLSYCASKLIQTRGNLEIREGNPALKKIHKIKQINPKHEIELKLSQSVIDLWDTSDLSDFVGGVIHLYLPQRF